MMTKEELRKDLHNDPELMYMVLSRMKADCQYFIDACNCREGAQKYLWAKVTKDHIQYMKYLYELVPEKPEWLTMEEIEAYEKKMVK